LTKATNIASPDSVESAAFKSAMQNQSLPVSDLQLMSRPRRHTATVMRNPDGIVALAPTTTPRIQHFVEGATNEAERPAGDSKMFSTAVMVLIGAVVGLVALASCFVLHPAGRKFSHNFSSLWKKAPEDINVAKQDIRKNADEPPCVNTSPVLPPNPSGGAPRAISLSRGFALSISEGLGSGVLGALERGGSTTAGGFAQLKEGAGGDM